MTVPTVDPGVGMVQGAGRFAPSPTGDLHVGNLRTALLAWLWARHTHRRFVVRVEDLDRVRAGSAGVQLRDLAEIGLLMAGKGQGHTDGGARA